MGHLRRLPRVSRKFRTKWREMLRLQSEISGFVAMASTHHAALYVIPEEDGRAQDGVGTLIIIQKFGVKLYNLSDKSSINVIS